MSMYVWAFFTVRITMNIVQNKDKYYRVMNTDLMNLTYTTL